MYQDIIQNMHQNDAKFKQLEPKHKGFVKKQIFRPIQSNTIKLNEESSLVVKIKGIVEQANKEKRPRELSQEEKQDLFEVLQLTGADKDEAKVALAHANNEQEKAQQLVTDHYVVPKV